MDALGENFNLQYSSDQATQRCGTPQLAVVATAGIQADYQAWTTQTFAEMFQMRRQIRTAAFLAGFDNYHATRVRDRLCLQCAHRRQACEHGVAIIRCAAAKQPVILNYRLPGTQSVAPSSHLGLLIEMPI